MATRPVKNNGRSVGVRATGDSLDARGDSLGARGDSVGAREPRLPLWARPGYLVRRLHQVNYALWLEELGHENVTPVQYGILTALSIRGPLDQTTLADEVGIDRTNVAEVLSRLEARKLVRRKENSADRRARLASITPKGRALMSGLFPAMQRSQDRLLAPLTQKERDLFMSTLTRLIEANTRPSETNTRPSEPTTERGQFTPRAD